MSLWPDLAIDKPYVTTDVIDAHIEKQAQIEKLELFQDAARGKVSNDNSRFKLSKLFSFML